MSLCESQENVNIYFVIPRHCSSEESCSNDMKSAYTSCVEQSLHPEWITENSCLKLTPVKKDVFVFSEFEGVAYEHLCSNKCVRIVGPRCILTCLTEGISIPEGRSAIYTVGMRGLLISTTGFDGEPKKQITKLVEFMGGVFTNKLRQSVTHLVAHSVLSEKYQKATEQGIPVMTEKWVLEVWEASKLRNVHATDDEFMSYKCPIFHNLCVTSSGLPHKERDTIKELINSNGGEYSGKLIGDQTHMLVIQEPYGEKFKYASQWQLPCVLPAWVQDSVKNGYALPVEPYGVKQKQKSSTPVHDDPRLPNFSMISAVGFGTGTVDETAMNTSTFSVISSRRSSIGSLIPPKYMEVVNKLTLADAKKAGPFLDGCKVYLSGFSLDVCENLRKILNAGGATRFSVLSDPVSHIIVGDHVPEDVNYLKKSGIRPHVVTIDWLLESLKQRRPAPEELFLVSGNNAKPAEPPSPLSKKGAHLLRRPSDVSSPIPLQIASDKPVEKKDAEAEEQADVTIVHQYLNASQSEPLENYGKASGSKYIPEVKQNDVAEVLKPNESSQSLLSENTSQSSGCPAIFKGLTFSTAGFTEEETQALEEVIKEKGGRVVHRGFKGIPDYGIVPLEGERLYHTTNAVVTHLWVEDCYECGELVPVNYYHQPVSLDTSTKPLKNCVIALTTYAGKEREFITSVAELLGARTQETFARVNNPEKGAIASTHLICPEPGSKKYLAALKWSVPAVNHRWLLACAREGRCVNEEPYLVKEPSSPREVEGSHSSGRGSDVNHSKLGTPVTLPKEIQNAEEKQPQAAALVVEETVPSVNVTRSSDSARKSMGPPGTAKVPTTNERERRRTTGPVNSPSTPAGNPKGTVQNLGFSPFSQETPIRTLISSVTDNANVTPNNGWTFDPNEATPKPPNYMSTPETPYGQVFKPNPSPTTRKNWKRWIDSIPEFEKLEPEEKKRRLSTPLSEIKRQIWEKFGGIKIPRKLKTEELQQEEDNTLASPHVAARPLHFSPVAGTSKDNLQSESSPQAEKVVAQQDPQQPEATQNGPSAGINTQLHALGEILTVPVNSPRAPLFEGGEETPNKVKIVDQGESKKTENLPASLEINTDCVDWVDPAVSDEASQEVKQPPKIMLSNVEDRDSYVKMIMDLGGHVSDKTVFDPTATHLICGKPARSEKLLGSIASGKWVLHKSFIDASCRAGTFVKEEEYEWGNPKAKELWSQLRPGSVDMALAKAVYRWRCKLCGSNRGAFSAMRAIIHTNQEKAASFARLIKAGGGQVLDVRPPYKNPQGATHCFAELNKLNEPIDMEALVKNKVPCLSPLYLNNYLVNDPPPDADSCVLPEFSRVMQQLDR
ncbi:DNA topoisomerase 2-binding protein 1-A-like isoform X1 [Schistocerca gregaria]|uniref:DNA topoisomerase 2-binding protein 1-A-like isoform X1 n=1 Tax=Schistocerca gregaria TaxID=7010 RepID=UPI00211E5C0F|nr:DNA topoisomerase 2-binding protein 1-A-like isoform X1 [Schistocerca gregaria]